MNWMTYQYEKLQVQRKFACIFMPPMFRANKTTVFEGEVLLEGFICLHAFEQF